MFYGRLGDVSEKIVRNGQTDLEPDATIVVAIITFSNLHFLSANPWPVK